MISCVEVWLQRELKKLDKTTKGPLENLINEAKGVMISRDEADKLHDLRRTRNRHIHFDIRRLSKGFKSIEEIWTGESFSQVMKGKRTLGFTYEFPWTHVYICLT